MRQSRVLTVLAVLTVLLLLSAGPAAPTDPQWEYGTYEVIHQTKGRAQKTFRWQTRQSVVSAQDNKFRLFMKLGIYCNIETAHELMLWNHLGKEGWEFVTHHAISTQQADSTLTIFRRLRK